MSKGFDWIFKWYARYKSKNVEEYNPGRKCSVLIAFNDMIADIISNKKLDQVVTEVFIRGRKVNISTVVITQAYFSVPKDIKQNRKHLMHT